MPPPGYEPFLRAICENPADDTVRLVYADWLDENGDPARAEFIRLQIELEHRRRTQSFDRAFLERHAATHAHSQSWLAELPRLPGVNWPGAFHRGFPYQVDVSDGRWLVRHREEVFAAAPIEELSVAGAGLRTLTRVLEIPELVRISRLWLHQCRLAAGEWFVVARCAHLTRVAYLGLSRVVQTRYPPRGGFPDPILTPGDAMALAGSPFLPRRMELHLNGWIGPDTFEVLQARFDKVIAGRR